MTLRPLIAAGTVALAALLSLTANSSAQPTSILALDPATTFDASGFLSRVETRPSDTSRERLLMVDVPALRRLVASRSRVTIENFPVGAAESHDIVLESARPVVDSRTRVRIGAPGVEIAGPLPPVAVYRGAIAREEGSRVFVAVVGESLFGFVERSDERRYVIGPSTLDGAHPGAHALVAEGSFPDAVIDAASTCLADATTGDRRGVRRDDRAAYAPGLHASSLLEVRVAVEADQEFFRRSGATVEKATAYIIALWSMVSSMYEDELDVTFRLPWIKVWTTQDPYQVAGNGYGLWGKAPEYWRQNYADVERDLAHIFTASDWGGGGIAFRGEGIDGRQTVICSREYGYAMSSPRAVLTYPTFAFTYDAYIVAHETGHNFGARHTHDCWWNPAIDTCMTRDDQSFRMDDACLATPVTPTPSEGSIMSYCMGINQKASGGSFESWKVRLAFTPRVASTMRSEAELAPCRRSPASPTIVLTRPRGQVKTLHGDSVVTISWNAEGVGSYDVELSIDNARTWSTIAAGLAADVLAYRWTVPRICADSVRVRVVDASDATVADTSLLPVTIATIVVAPAITPAGPLRFCDGDSLRLSAPDGYAGYRWTNGDTTRNIVVKTSGVYEVIARDSGGCEASSAPAVVTVVSVPRPTITRRADTLFASAAPRFQWSLDGEAIPGATQQWHRVTLPGLYAVSTFDSILDCGATSEPIAVTSSGIHDATTSRSDLRVEPAIGADCCEVRLTLVERSHVSLRVFDNSGRHVATLVDERIDAGPRVVTWDPGGLAAGTYWVVLRSADEVEVRAVVVR